MAKDAFGNVSTGYTGTVTFSSSDAKASLPASYTFTAADAGLHTFTATLKSAGTQSITVKDAASSTVVGLKRGSPSRARPRSPRSPSPVSPRLRPAWRNTFTVSARDAFGNLCSGYTER